MKVLMLNGSAHQKGNTYLSLLEVGKTLEKEGIEYEIFQIGGGPVRDCIGCGKCSEKGCVFDDDKVNEFVAKAKEADGFIHLINSGAACILCAPQREDFIFSGPGVLQQQSGVCVQARSRSSGRTQRRDERVLRCAE